MASCDDDDDFSILRDDSHHSHHLHQTFAPHHHHHNHHTHHHFSTASVHSKPVADDDTDDYGNPFDDDAGSEKRKDRDEIGDGTTSYAFNKRPKPVSSGSGGVGGVGAEYRKDREEWSDTAIVCLLEAYTEKFAQLNRGNLRGRDWEEVASVVSERCENQSKSVEQCKNKVDNLKKRYKLERHRMNNGCISNSHWPWYKQMEHIVGNSLPSKFADYDKAIVPASISPRQSKRFIFPAP
jgi:uridylate kinase